MDKVKQIGGYIVAGIALIFFAYSAFTAKERVVVLENDNGKTIEINSEQCLQLKFRNPPATGLSWSIESYDKNILKNTDEEEYEYGSEEHENKYGTDEDQDIQLIEFEVLKAGETELKLIFHRSYEKDVPPQKTFAIKVKTTMAEEEKEE